MASLTRVELFTYTGVDFAGPLLVRDVTPKTSSKVWICVYTCLVTRAVHLDIVCSLSTDDFLHCLKRFASRVVYPEDFCLTTGRLFDLRQDSFVLCSKTVLFKITLLAWVSGSSTWSMLNFELCNYIIFV